MNIFSVLGLRDEKYHNRMLAWLLNPQESHGLGFRFLADFLNLVDIKHNPETFAQIKAEYTIPAPDNVRSRRPDIYLQTDESYIFIENKVRRASIDMGFNMAEMQQYVEFSETFARFKSLEKSAGTQIQAFLSVVGEEVQDRFATLTGQNDWQI